jgi:WG containing repeat
MINRKYWVSGLLLCSLYQLQAQDNRVFPYYNGQKWGLTNEKLEVLAQPRYDTVGYMYYNSLYYTYVKLNGKYGHIDHRGMALYTPQFDALGNLYGTEAASYCSVKKGDKWGYVSLPSGKITCPTIYDRVSYYGFSNRPEFIQVYLKNKTGVANLKTGKLFCPVEYDEINHLQRELLSMRKGKLWVLAHLQKGILGKPRFESIEYLWGVQLYQAMSKGKATYFDGEGKTVAPPPPVEEEMGVKEDMGAVPPVDMGDMGRAYSSRVYNNGNKSWKIAIEKQNGSYSPVTIVKTFELEGYDDLVILYDNTWEKQENATIYLKAKKQGKYGLIDMTGKTMIPLEYDDLRNESNYFTVTKAGLQGMYSRDYKVLYAPMFTYAMRVQDGLLRVDLADGRKGYAGINGKLYIPAK